MDKETLLCYDSLTGDLLKAELRDGTMYCSSCLYKKEFYENLENIHNLNPQLQCYLFIISMMLGACNKEMFITFSVETEDSIKAERDMLDGYKLSQIQEEAEKAFKLLKFSEE